MNLEEAKAAIERCEAHLDQAPFHEIHRFERNGRTLSLCITQRLRQRCTKGRVWKGKAMLSAIKNGEYGFDPHHAHSPGGYDGIFVLTRDHKPRNEMMRKLFDQFLDKRSSGADELAEALQAPLADLKPVRLVSHHMRLLGLLLESGNDCKLVLVDYDDTK